MKAKAHVIGGMAATFSTYYLIKKYEIPITLIPTELFFSGFLGSLLPDIDHKKSMLGSIIHLPVKHRTLTHSLLFLAGVFFLTARYNLSIATGLGCGILSHLILDMFGKRSAGICLFYPFKKRVRFFHF